MTETAQTPYVVLRAQDRVRGESVNAGIVLFAPAGPLVSIAPDSLRIKALHPDYAALRLDGWAQSLEQALGNYSAKLGETAQKIALLPLLVHPFIPDQTAGMATLNIHDPQETLAELMSWLVLPRKINIRPAKSTAKRPTRLGMEIRTWLKNAKAFSSRIEDLSKNRVVANYPIDPGADLYADLALMNGKLHVMEVMDLRGMDKLTASARGDAAIKGITLDEAKAQANPIAIVAASDYAVAKPAIHLISRYANDVFDLGTLAERDRFAAFVAKSLHRTDLASQAIHLAQ